MGKARLCSIAVIIVNYRIALVISCMHSTLTRPGLPVTSSASSWREKALQDEQGGPEAGDGVAHAWVPVGCLLCYWSTAGEGAAGSCHNVQARERLAHAIMCRRGSGWLMP